MLTLDIIVQTYYSSISINEATYNIMEKHGRQRKLTKQQQDILRKNPNVAKVTDYQVWYTQTFKNYFCSEYSKGRFASDIFREQGIDPLILGSTRVATMRRYYNEVKRTFPGNTVETANSNPYRGAKGQSHHDDGVNLDGDVMRAVGKLEQHIQYMDTQINMLKKIFAADSNAIKAYIRNRPNQKNSK